MNDAIMSQEEVSSMTNGKIMNEIKEQAFALCSREEALEEVFVSNIEKLIAERRRRESKSATNSQSHSRPNNV